MQMGPVLMYRPLNVGFFLCKSKKSRGDRTGGVGVPLIGFEDGRRGHRRRNVSRLLSLGCRLESGGYLTELRRQPVLGSG